MIAIGSDHGGWALKQELMKWLTEQKIAYKDFGCYTPESVDYPDIAEPVANAVAGGQYEKGILLCGTGVGISMAANKVNGVRAACCSDCFSAKLTRQHNNANILCMGGRVVGPGLAIMMTDLFLHTAYEGGRHQRRLDKLTAIEKRQGGD
ncbi:MAG: ribose 5-phosphate isomerase B [Oscillospiraceae bacterium]|jgi:ribose 5-phosphate isomerase B|nr:ribose 5-phosphate isomerase B [Oscillospiraceae bacterium]MDD3260365.1 ribose 5-phosphate isomerase B [Oscillospiraceae bacterium]